MLCPLSLQTCLGFRPSPSAGEMPLSRSSVTNRRCIWRRLGGRFGATKYLCLLPSGDHILKLFKVASGVGGARGAGGPNVNSCRCCSGSLSLSQTVAASHSHSSLKKYRLITTPSLCQEHETMRPSFTFPGVSLVLSRLPLDSWMDSY